MLAELMEDTMNRKHAQTVWKTKERPADLVLVSDKPASNLWAEPTDGLVEKVKERLRGVRVTATTSAAPGGLQSVLGAAAFLGAQTIVVVRLWNGDNQGDFGLQKEMWKRGIRIIVCEAPAEEEAISAAYHTATLTELAGAQSAFPGTAVGPLSNWAA
jgi:hypothetical protein